MKLTPTLPKDNHDLLLVKIRKYSRGDGVHGLDDPEECHLWIGSVSAQKATVYHQGNAYSPRRVLFETEVRPLLPGERVFDTCGEQLCCNLRHLYGATLGEAQQRARRAESEALVLETATKVATHKGEESQR